jgi:hypothetical protein
MTTININVTSVFIHILLFFIIYSSIHWYFKLNDTPVERDRYRLANIFSSLLTSIFIFILCKVLYHFYSHSHFTFTF